MDPAQAPHRPRPLSAAVEPGVLTQEGEACGARPLHGLARRRAGAAPLQPLDGAARLLGGRSRKPRL